MGVKKRTTLHTAFWRFLFLLLGGLLGAVLIPFMVMSVGITLGVINYADYSEIQAKELVPIIASTPELSEIQIPMGIKYLVLDNSYQPLGTNMEKDEMEAAVAYATTGRSNTNLKKQYLFVTREKEYVVLQYYIGSQFTNDWMNEHLPSPEILMSVCMGINCIAVCFMLTAGFAKKLRSQLKPLFEATLEISKQNLDFEVGHSQIKEFEDVLLSFSDMKDSLRNSLEQQWKAEQMQREQIAALAHDLKTPLTIIQGNADLIGETKLNEEQRQYAEYITVSSEQMQLYIKTLIDLSRAAAGYPFHMERIEFPCYLEGLKAQMEALCRTKDIELQVKVTDLPDSLTLDKQLMERAVMNVVSNALDYSPEGGTIYISITGEKDKVQISVTDEGKGFSQESLSHARERFYMADGSRGMDLHFGMGVYITGLLWSNIMGICF